MTSHKRSSGNTSITEEDPILNTFLCHTHTWGKIVVRHDIAVGHVRHMPIKGVLWPLPRIQPEHFNIGKFFDIVHETMKKANRFYGFDYLRSETALRKGGLIRQLLRPLLRWLDKHVVESEFLWLDIACIDERDGPFTKMAEIGRQARIFQNAEHTYVWRCNTSHQTLQSSLDSLIRHKRASGRALRNCAAFLQYKALHQRDFAGDQGSDRRPLV